MNIRWLMLLLVGALVTATAAAQGTDKERDGTWVLVSLEQDGKRVDDEVLKKLDLTLILKGEKYMVKSGDTVLEEGTGTLDKTKKPNTLDIKPTEGMNKGKTIPAIVEMKGELMLVCYNLDGNERPKEFATKAGSGFLLASYKKK